MGALLALAACRSTVQIDSHGSGGGGSTSSPGGGSGATGAGGSGASAGSGTGASADCASGLPPYAGPLCGPMTSPCNLLADENMGVSGGNNDAPAVAVGPDCSAHVVFAALTPDFEGIYADRLGPGEWQQKVLPGPSALAGHVIGSDGTSYLLTYDGAFHTTLRARPPGGDWQALGTLPEDGWFRSAGLAKDDADRLHAAWVDKEQHLLYAAREAGGPWALTKWQEPASADDPQVAATPEGVAHVVYWSQSPEGWVPRYVSPSADDGPPSLTEPVAEPGKQVLEPRAERVKLALSADGTPLLLLVQKVGDPPAPKMSVARREPTGGWTLKELVKPQKDDNPCDNTIPSNTSDECVAQTAVQLVPIATVVSRGGDTRFLYSRQYTESSYEPKCTKPQGIETFCTWELKSSVSRGTIHIARFGAGVSVIGKEIATGLPYSGNAVIDGQGTIHVAVYDASDKDRPTRYLQIGF